MKFVGLSTVFSLGAIGTIALLSSPAQAQHVSIPVTNGSFTITNVGGNLQYTTMPTFLSPAGTLTITGADPFYAGFHATGPIAINTPVGFIDFANSLAGSVNLNDGRTATFTGAGASLRGIATVTGISSLTLPLPHAFVSISNGILPNGASLSYTAQSGAIHIPAASLSTYPTPQLTIPIVGGNFTLTDPTGTGNATVTLNSVLTPLGTATLTLNDPNLSNPTGYPRASTQYYPGPTATVSLGGLANGTIALGNGRIATVANRLVSLTANTQVTPLPLGFYVQGAWLLTTPVTIQGTITGGTISVPEAAVTPLPAPVQPPAVVEQKVISVVPPKQPELALGFAKNVMLREPFEFMDVKGGKQQMALEDLPEVERSALEFSRIHPGLHGTP